MVFLVKKARRAATEIKKFEKRDLAQVVINAAYLVACADGECEASEKAKIEQVLRNQPALYAFTSEINAISATIIGQLDTNFKTGRRAALREIEDVKHLYLTKIAFCLKKKKKRSHTQLVHCTCTSQ
ncbi:hypothetical protein, partial [Escherichia coli]|uniref:hypothetical protein n=1 Tax=Escherichia coli TaxID=562 RepID=UPI00207BA5A5